MNLVERDKKHLWHPLTQHKIHSEHLPIVKAKDCLLFDESGKSYIDGIASWYTCMYGHCNEIITSKIKEQLDELDQVVFNGFTHKPAIELSEKLIAILPDNQEKIFFSDNGSTSVDIAIKMALQYFFNKNKKRTGILALEDAFHGDTFGAMSVSDLSVYNGPFKDLLLKVDRIDISSNDSAENICLKFESMLEKEKFAVFIFEPLVQGAAAMKMYSPELLDRLISIAKKNDVLTVADEVMTGFGKTGKNFASEYLKNKPDIICLSKSLTAGIAPMAITSCSQEVYDSFYSKDILKGFFHGHTYSANPLACAAAIAGIDLLISDDIQERIIHISKRHLEFARRVKSHKKVKATRNLGVIFALDIDVSMERYGDLRNRLFEYFMDNGVYLRPLGNTIYILPPFIIKDKELDKIYEVIENCLEII